MDELIKLSPTYNDAAQKSCVQIWSYDIIMLNITFFSYSTSLKI